MSKTKVFFDDVNYNIKNETLNTYASALKAYLQNVINGSGAVINLNKVSYNVNPEKLATAKNNLISHCQLIAGSGVKVIIDEVEYNINSAEVADDIIEIHKVLSGLHDPEEEPETPEEPEESEYFWHSSTNSGGFHKEAGRDSYDRSSIIRSPYGKYEFVDSYSGESYMCEEIEPDASKGYLEPCIYCPELDTIVVTKIEPPYDYMEGDVYEVMPENDISIGFDLWAALPLDWEEDLEGGEWVSLFADDITLNEEDVTIYEDTTEINGITYRPSRVSKYKVYWNGKRCYCECGGDLGVTHFLRICLPGEKDPSIFVNMAIDEEAWFEGVRIYGMNELSGNLTILSYSDGWEIAFPSWGPLFTGNLTGILNDEYVDLVYVDYELGITDYYHFNTDDMSSVRMASEWNPSGTYKVFWNDEECESGGSCNFGDYTEVYFHVPNLSECSIVLKYPNDLSNIEVFFRPREEDMFFEESIGGYLKVLSYSLTPEKDYEGY